ncbi:MAG TPA: hypothetical protein VF619_07900 [Allosphingosinicella sp.]
MPVRSARVVIANYQAILHDFPQVFAGPEAFERFRALSCAACVERRRICRRAIDDWLIRNAAFVSAAQAKPNRANSAIDHGPSVRRGYRPPRYGRALVLPIEEGAAPGQAGFLDIKGIGVAPDRVPENRAYANGLEYLGQVLADYFYGALIDKVFARACPGYCTVPVYAVIDLGFDVVDYWHGTAPAGLHVRRAHTRHEGGVEIPMSGSDEEKIILHMELLLRAWGLTTADLPTSYHVETVDGVETLKFSAWAVEPKNEREAEKARVITEIARSGRLELINVQLIEGLDWQTRHAQMVDMGHISVRRNFRFPFANPTRDSLLRVGRVIKPGDRAFVQPVAEHALDADLCSKTSVFAFGFAAAQAFSNRFRPMSSHDIETIYRIGIARAFGRRYG